MPDVVFSVFNEKFMTPSKLVDFSLKFGSIGIAMLFAYHNWCLWSKPTQKSGPSHKVFVIPKDLRLSEFS